MVKLYLLYGIIITNIFICHGVRHKMAKLDRLDVCYIPENPPYKVHYFDLVHLADMHYSLSASGEALEEIQGDDIEADIVISRCHSREQLDSCERLPKLKPPRFCDFIRLKELGIRDLMEKFTPPIRCPIHKTNYSVKDLRYSMDTWTLFPIGNNYWKARASAYVKKRLVGTICLDLQTFDMNGN